MANDIAGERATYFASTTLNRLMTAVFLLACVTSGVCAATAVAILIQFDGSAPPMSNHALADSVAMIVSLVVNVLAAFVFCVWLYRANSSAWALGAQDMEHTPGWSIGWFFIPLANLIMPYHAVCEVYRASAMEDDSDRWKNTPTPAVFAIWWSTWILSNITSRIGSRMRLMERDDWHQAGTVIALVGESLAIVAAGCVIRVVWLIRKRQREKARQIEVPLRAPSRGIAGIALIGCLGVTVVAFLSILIVMASVGIGINQGFLPDTVAKSRENISPHHMEQLVELGVVDDEEDVLFFYSGGILSIAEDGNLFTDKSIVSYETFDGELNVYSATFDEVESIEFEPDDSWAGDSVIRVSTFDEGAFVLYVSNEEGGDRAFFNRLKKQWNQKREANQETSGAQD